MDYEFCQQRDALWRVFGGENKFYCLSFFTPAEPMRKQGAVLLLAPLDIAVMKIIAISQRGKKRDFLTYTGFVKT